MCTFLLASNLRQLGTFDIQFFLGGSCVAFGYAAKETNIDTDYWSRKISKMSTIWSTRTPSSDEMRRTKTFELRAVR